MSLSFRFWDFVANAGFGSLAARASLALVGAAKVLLVDAGYEMAVVVGTMFCGKDWMFLGVCSQLVSEMHALLERLTDVLDGVIGCNGTTSKSTIVIKLNCGGACSSSAASIAQLVLCFYCCSTGIVAGDSNGSYTC